MIKEKFDFNDLFDEEESYQEMLKKTATLKYDEI